MEMSESLGAGRNPDFEDNRHRVIDAQDSSDSGAILSLGETGEVNRLEARALDYWASLLNGRQCPAIEDLDLRSSKDFDAHGILFDFTGDRGSPKISHMGAEWGEHLAGSGENGPLDETLGYSLVTHLKKHFSQIFAEQVPIDFEEVFLKSNGDSIVGHGVLLPWTSGGDQIDFILAVMNWKGSEEDGEVSDPSEQPDILLLDEEAGQRLSGEQSDEPSEADVLMLNEEFEANGTAIDGAHADGRERDERAADAIHNPPWFKVSLNAAASKPLVSRPTLPATSGSIVSQGTLARTALSAVPAGNYELTNRLDEARKLASAAIASEVRSRKALYEALGCAYDFSLAAEESPEEFLSLLDDCGLKTSDRSPMIPVVKLVFGADYDKTRLAEYATVLSHARRIGLKYGDLAPLLIGADGGLKALVNQERQLRKLERGQGADRRPKATLTDKLRAMPTQSLTDLAREGDEFTLVLARRLPDGGVAVVGEIPHDVPLLEKAARKLVAQND